MLRSRTFLGLALLVGVALVPLARTTAYADDAPEIPGYFTGTSADPAKPAWPDPTGGASGVWATPAGDGKGDVPSALGVPDVYDRVVHNLYSINYVWVLIAGFLVMFMQAGFMLVETGLCRAKNAAHTSAMNLMIYPLGCLAFWAYGFAIGWGNWWNGPVPPGWYPSLGPGLAALNGGVGLGAATDAAGNLTGAYTYGLMAYAWFKLSNLITPIRVPRDVELEGLDSPEMGTLGYPDFQIHQEQRMAG